MNSHIEFYTSRDDTVEVGADLYEIDTEATATVEAGAPPPVPTAAISSIPRPLSSPSEPSSNKQDHRTPSIQFLGKDGWAQLLSAGRGPEVEYLPPSYGRPRFTEDEMEALMLGGASLSPDVVRPAFGAKFKAI